MDFQAIHQKALSLAKRFKSAQAQLLDVLQTIDEKKIFRKLGFNSTFEYCLKALGLGENEAYSLIRVSRKSHEVPELKQAVQEGKINLAAAKRVSAVIEPDNKDSWIEKAATLPQRQLEKEIVKIKPKACVPDSIRPIREDRSEIRCNVDGELEGFIKRIQDLESQRRKSSCDLEGAFRAMAEAYLEKYDPLRKANRNKQKPKKPSALSLNLSPVRTPVPAHIKHQVNNRDLGQCAFVEKDGRRCSSRRHLMLHHVKPLALGGKHSENNLVTLCFSHHQAIHEGVTAFRLWQPKYQQLKQKR